MITLFEDICFINYGLSIPFMLRLCPIARVYCVVTKEDDISVVVFCVFFNTSVTEKPEISSENCIISVVIINIADNNIIGQKCLLIFIITMFFCF